MTYSTVTLTGKLLDPSGNPVRGTVTVLPNVARVLDAAGHVVLTGGVTAALDATGAFSIVLPATDDVRLAPSGFQYVLHGPGGLRVTFSLPATPATTDLAVLTPVAPAPVAAESLTDATVTALLNNPASGVSAALNATRRIVPASKAQAWGHSYMAGVTPDGDGFGHPGMAQAIADGQKLSLEQHAVGGSVLYRHSSAGAWADLFKYAERPESFTELGGLYPTMYGMNDMSLLGGTALALRAMLEAYKACVSRIRAGGWFSSIHSSVALAGAGAWTNLPDIVYTGDHVAFNPTSGATVTVTTPANMPAGYVTPVFMTWSDVGGGTTWTGSNAAAGFSIDTHPFSRTDAYIPAVLRIPTTGGAGTYTFTTSGSTGGVGALFLGWLWEPLSDSGPLVVLVEQPKPLDYAAYAGSPFVPTDAAVDIMNAELVSLASGFGSPRVISVDTSAMDKSATYFLAGNVHCNQAGHTKIADLVTKALAATATFLHAPLDVPAPVAWTRLTYAGAWVDFDAANYVPGRYRKIGDEVEIEGLCKSGTGAIATLPVGYRPPKQILVTCSSDTGPARYWIAANGVMTYVSGGTGHFSLGVRFSVTP